MKISVGVFALFLLLIAGCVTTPQGAIQEILLTSDAPGGPPLIDAHQHIIPGLSAETIILLMDQAGVQKSILMANRIAGSRPLGWEDGMVLEAYEKYPQRIIPFLTTVRGGRGLLPDEAFLEYAERQLKTGKFKGLGEFMVKHFAISVSPGTIAPEVSIPADSPWMQAMMRLGVKYSVPLLIHFDRGNGSSTATKLLQSKGDYYFALDHDSRWELFRVRDPDEAVSTETADGNQLTIVRPQLASLRQGAGTMLFDFSKAEVAPRQGSGSGLLDALKAAQ